MPFTLSAGHLARLCQINNFAVPDSGMIFFGLRGCLPADPANHDFAPEHQLSMRELNYVNPRCTIGQWRAAQGDFAVYPGSTVPYLEVIKSSKLRNAGAGVNQLMTGYYPKYERKEHSPVHPENAHMAFSLQEGSLSYIRRTVDDLDFDAFDTFDVENPHDNIHAAYGMSVDGHYSSAGCQVVVGYPACRNPRFTPEGGPWKIFKQRAYAEAQELFPYFLLEARNAATLADAPDEPTQALLRFGSSGDLVRRLQEKLGVGVDSSFGETTLRAVIELQGHRLGIAEADGVVGGRTASLLDLDWPTV